MLSRRELLARGTTILLLVPFVSSCSSSNNASSIDAAGTTCTGIDSTSTVDEAHTHTICVQTSDLTTPPSGGVTYTSSNVGNHTHTLMLTAAQLASIESGTAVGPVESSSVVDPVSGVAHTHDWTIMKM
jgi:hypothetical protein